MERTEFQQRIAELKEQNERRRYDALRKKYAIAPDFSNMSLRDEIGVRYDLDELEQLKQKFGMATNMPMDNALAARMDNQRAQPSVQRNYISQPHTVEGVFDIFSVKNNTRALLNVLQGYNQLSPLRVNDKYKHSVISCLGAQGGVSSIAAMVGLGVAKEVYDIAKKIPNSQKYGGYGAVVKDSLTDLLADARGVVQGYDNPTANCYNMMQNFYPVNIR